MATRIFRCHVSEPRYLSTISSDRCSRPWAFVAHRDPSLRFGISERIADMLCSFSKNRVPETRSAKDYRALAAFRFPQFFNGLV
jgi:hypothetical protein